MNKSEFCLNEEALAPLREQVKNRLSPKRWNHTAQVEEMVARLAKLYCPEKENLLRAAALFSCFRRLRGLTHESLKFVAERVEPFHSGLNRFGRFHIDSGVF